MRAASGATTTRSAPGAGVTMPVACTTPRIVPSEAAAVFTRTTVSLSTSSTFCRAQPGIETSSVISPTASAGG